MDNLLQHFIERVYENYEDGIMTRSDALEDYLNDNTNLDADLITDFSNELASDYESYLLKQELKGTAYAEKD